MIGAVQAALLGLVRGSGITYILNWSGAGASDASFSNGDVLDTAAEGIVGGAGALQVLIPVAGTVAISSGKMILTHDASAGLNEFGVITDSSFTHDSTVCVYVRCRMNPAGTGTIRFTSTKALGNPGGYNYISFNPAQNVFSVSSLNPNLPPAVNNAASGLFNDAVLLCGGFTTGFVYDGTSRYGTFGFQKKAADSTWSCCGFSSYAGYSLTGSQYAQINFADANCVEYLDTLRIFNSSALRAEFIARCVLNLSDSVLTPCISSDNYIYVAITTPGSLPAAYPTYVDFNMSDADNGWRCKIVPATSGTTVTFHKITSGSEGAALASLSMAFAESTSYSLCIAKSGNAQRRFFSAGSLGGPGVAYTTSDTYNTSETKVRITAGSSSVISSMVIPITGYTLTL